MRSTNRLRTMGNMTMSPLKLRLKHDRLMRDAARQVVGTDVELLKAGVAQKPVTTRAAETGGDYLRQIGDGALDLFEENRGTVAGGLTLAAAAIAVWLYRDQIGDMIAGILDPDEDDDGEEPRQSGDIST